MQDISVYNRMIKQKSNIKINRLRILLSIVLIIDAEDTKSFQMENTQNLLNVPTKG